jgi:hypothetical protein
MQPNNLYEFAGHLLQFMAVLVSIASDSALPL